MTSHDASALWQPLVEHGAHWCAPNVHAEAGWLDVDGVPWAVARTQPTLRNCYVVSATGQYLDYALEETRRLPGRPSRVGATLGLRAIAPLLRRLDPIVVLDALPVSTILHARRSADEWQRAIEVARHEFHGLPIVIRSVDEVHTPGMMQTLVATGLEPMTSRLVFHQDPREASFWRIRNVQHDLRLAEQAPMESRALEVEDAPRIAALYWQLYGEKHSTLNPQFSAAWLAHGMSAGALSGEGILHEGHLVAAYLSYRVDDVMTNPVFGYDTALPQAMGLYRRLSLLTMQSARRDGVRIHASSGAPGFKASRGGLATVEYHAVDLHTVTGAQRAAWRATIGIAQRLGPRMLASAT